MYGRGPHQRRCLFLQSGTGIPADSFLPVLFECDQYFDHTHGHAVTLNTTVSVRSTFRTTRKIYPYIFEMIPSVVLVLLQVLSTLKQTTGEESSYLASVLTNIQRERLGLLDQKLGGHINVDRQNDDNLYLNGADDSLGTVLLDNRHSDENTFSSSKITDEQLASLYTQHSQQPGSDLIYIYNDTIYLYKAPNASEQTSVQHPGLSEILHHASPYQGNQQLAVLPVAEHDGTNAIDDTDPETLINSVISDSGGDQEALDSLKQDNLGDTGGYYYYYYPLDNLPPELANSVANILSNPKRPAVMKLKPGVMPGMPMKPLPPVKSVMMKPKQPVGPLFKAMAVFVGTAVVFIASILLLPRVKLVKAKSASSSSDDSILWTMTHELLR